MKDVRLVQAAWDKLQANRLQGDALAWSGDLSRVVFRTIPLLLPGRLRRPRALLRPHLLRHPRHDAHREAAPFNATTLSCVARLGGKDACPGAG